MAAAYSLRPLRRMGAGARNCLEPGSLLLMSTGYSFSEPIDFICLQFVITSTQPPPNSEELRMRNKRLRIFGTIILMAASATALAFDQPLHVNGAGMTFRAASADALNQAQGMCAALGGTVINFEVTTSGTAGGQSFVYALAICRIP